MKKIIILFICLTCSIWHVCAQTKVSGIVKDAQGMEMIGATILQKGTNNGNLLLHCPTKQSKHFLSQ